MSRYSTIRARVEVEIGDLLDEIDDADLLEEVKDRGLIKGEASLGGDDGRRDDLARAVMAKDWSEVEYLLRTYFLREELRCGPWTPPSKTMASGRYQR